MDFHLLPKAELHCHLDGSLRPETLLELLREQGVDAPAKDVASLKQALRAGEVRESLEEYLRAFELSIAALKTEAAIERVAYELVEDCAKDGIIRLEARFSPLLHRPLPLERAVEAAWRGLARGGARFDVSVGLILCAIRSLSPKDSLVLAEVAAAYAGRGVCGFDLAGPEAGFPASAHQAAFDIVHRAGLGITVHAGEAEGAWAVREAIEMQRALRVGHGTHITEDRALIEHVRDAGIALEVCLQSNVETRSVPALKDHPFALLLRDNVCVTLNTDNRLMSDTNLSSEYARAAEAFLLTREELRQLCLNSVTAAFVDGETRQRLGEKANRMLDQTE